MDWIARLSPRGTARVAGIFEFLEGTASSQGQVFLLGSPLATYLFPVIAVVAALAELPLQFWLIIFGANSKRWYEQARAAESSPKREAAAAAIG